MRALPERISWVGKTYPERDRHHLSRERRKPAECQHSSLLCSWSAEKWVSNSDLQRSSLWWIPSPSLEQVNLPSFRWCQASPQETRKVTHHGIVPCSNLLLWTSVWLPFRKERTGRGKDSCRQSEQKNPAVLVSQPQSRSGQLRLQVGLTDSYLGDLNQGREI